MIPNNYLIKQATTNSKSRIFVNIPEDNNEKINQFEFFHSNHSSLRSRTRGINNKYLSLVIAYGSQYQKQGLLYYVLGKKEITKYNLDISINDCLVVIIKSDILITTYFTKNISGHRYIKKKSKIRGLQF